MNRRNNARYRANETRMEAAALELMRARDKVSVRPRCERAGIDDPEEMARMLVFFQAGFTMVLRRWVSRGCRDDVRSVARTLAACVPEAWAADGTHAVGERTLAGGAGGVPGGGC